MAAQYEALFTPFKIGNCEIRNRIIIPAMEGTNIVDNMMGPSTTAKHTTITSKEPRTM